VQSGYLAGRQGWNSQLASRLILAILVYRSGLDTIRGEAQYISQISQMAADFAACGTMIVL
jgi:hypothetical protein